MQPRTEVLDGRTTLSVVLLPSRCIPHACSSSASRFATGNEVIGIDLGTTNSCVAGEPWAVAG